MEWAKVLHFIFLVLVSLYEEPEKPMNALEYPSIEKLSRAIQDEDCSLAVLVQW